MIPFQSQSSNINYLRYDFLVYLYHMFTVQLRMSTLPGCTLPNESLQSVCRLSLIAEQRTLSDLQYVAGLYHLHSHAFHDQLLACKDLLPW